MKSIKLLLQIINLIADIAFTDLRNYARLFLVIGAYIRHKSLFGKEIND